MRRKRHLPLHLSEVAEKLDGKVLDDDSGIEVSGLCTLQESGPGDLTFIANPKYAKKAKDSAAGAFLVGPETDVEGRPAILVDHVWKAVLLLFDLWYPDEVMEPGVHPSAVVNPAAQLGEGVAVGPLAVIEAGAVIGDYCQIGAQCFVGRDVRMGKGCLLHPGVRALERTELGDRVILHSGAVLGGDGFGYEVIEGRGVKIPQVGNVVVESDVEIGANTTIDRAFLTATRIGMGTKVDNLVQIAHNCQIGRMCGIASQVGIAGSTVVGDGCLFWGQVGLKDNLKVGNQVELMGQCAPTGDVPDGQTLVGSPAYPLMESAKIFAAQKKLPDILKRLKKLEKALDG